MLSRVDFMGTGSRQTWRVPKPRLRYWYLSGCPGVTASIFNMNRTGALRMSSRIPDKLENICDKFQSSSQKLREPFLEAENVELCEKLQRFLDR